MKETRETSPLKLPFSSTRSRPDELPRSLLSFTKLFLSCHTREIFSFLLKSGFKISFYERLKCDELLLSLLLLFTNFKTQFYKKFEL